MDPSRHGNPARPPMFARLGCLFVVVPLVELALLVQVGRWIGVLPTVGIVAVTGLLGAALARGQGVRALAEFQREAAAGQVPAGPMLDAVSVLVGGLLLLTPGILSDLLGFALLLPPSRRFLQRRAMERLARGIRDGQVRVTFVGMPGGPAPRPPDGGDGRAAPLDDPDRPPRPGEILHP
jgi:UPF0716 protein FxsA